MPDVASSPTLLIALRDLDSTYGKALLKLALRHLIAQRVLRADAYYAQRMFGGPERRLMLVDGPGAVPNERLLLAVVDSVREVPKRTSRRGRITGDLADVAEQLGREPGRDGAVELALADLRDAELVRVEQRVRVRLLRRNVYTRTPEGQELLTRLRIPQRPHRFRVIDYPGGWYGSGDDAAFRVTNGHPDDVHAACGSDFDTTFDRNFDTGFDCGDGGDGGGGDGGD